MKLNKSNALHGALYPNKRKDKYELSARDVNAKARGHTTRLTRGHQPLHQQ
jgi:hypothetical protein